MDTSLTTVTSSSTASSPTPTSSTTTGSSTSPSPRTQQQQITGFKTILLMLLSMLVGYSFKVSVALSAVGSNGIRSLDLERDHDSPSFTTSLDFGTSDISTGSESTTTAPTPTCNGFFTVLADVWAASEKNCTTLYSTYQPLLKEHDEWMARTNSQLTVYTTWSAEELALEGCGNYAKVAGLNHTVFENFDPEALLVKHGFTGTQINWMKHWQDTVPRLRHALTRLSDVFRIVLQREYNKAYADLDVVYLMDEPLVYTQYPNVAVPVWSEEKGAMEIQNSAFCFSNPQLDVLIENIKSLLEDRGDSQLTKNRYIYTGMGPNLFQHSLQKLTLAGPTLRAYVTHSDDHWKLEDVSKLHQQYGKFVWLHLDGSNRRRNRYRNKGQTYRQLVQQLKKACPPPDISTILPPHILQHNQKQKQKQQ